MERGIINKYFNSDLIIRIYININLNIILFKYKYKYKNKYIYIYLYNNFINFIKYKEKIKCNFYF
jgi:hypothetical protein